MPCCIPLPPFPHVEGKRLSELSTFGIGGPARFFARASRGAELKEMFAYIRNTPIPFFILGKGSNTLFDDRGFDGLVILNAIEGFQQSGSQFKVGSGYSFPRLGQKTALLGYQGLEFAAGIPASVGGALFMNAGAGRQETFDTLQYVDYLTLEGEEKCFAKEQLTWGYRHSSLQEMRGAILGGCFALTLQEGVQERQKALVNYRLETQPYKMKSAGCVFRNPEGGNAGQWIEQLGLKGKRVGGVSVSTQHANFIVNEGGGKAEEVRALIILIQETVLREKGILLQEEIRYIPYVPIHKY